MNRLAILLFWIGALASLAAAASAPTFCKCTCFSNSTIIEIKSKSTGSSSSHLKEEGGSPSSNDEAVMPSSSTPSATPDLSDDNEAPTTTNTDTNTDTDAPAATDDDESILSSLDGFLTDTTPLSDFPQTPETLFDTTTTTTAKTHRRGSSSSSRGRSRRAQTTSPSCSQCNRAFCLSQSLPICKGATEKDVVTMCFQRDSRKDQIVVWGFILGTAGLLGWAALRKVMEMQENGAFIGAGGLLFGGGRGATTAAGRLGGGGGGLGGATGRNGGGGGGISSRLGLGRSVSSDDWRGQYASVATHSRQNSVAPLMGDSS